MTQFDDRFSGRPASRMLQRFGETIVYRPRNGIPRPITAMVTRRIPGLSGAAPEAISGAATVEVLPDSTNTTYGGIDPLAIDKGGDRIDIAEYHGRPVNKTLSIMHVPEHPDMGLFLLELH